MVQHPTAAPAPAPGAALLQGGGEMGGLVRSMDWARTGLGPIERWPQSLRTAAGTVLGSKFPMLLWWGPELIEIYNDAYRPVLGDKHPHALGARATDVWKEIWHIIGPMAEGILRGGPATWSEHLLLPMVRKGFREETYFTFSYSPVPDDAGHLGGVLVTCQETTAQVLSERRMRTLQRISASTTGAANGSEAAKAALRALEENANDLPFTALYLRAGNGRLSLEGSTGSGATFPRELSLDEDSPWPVARVLRTGTAVEVRLPAVQELVTGGSGFLPPSRAMLVPIARTKDETPAGVVVFGVSAALEFDEPYQSFLELAATQIASGWAQAEAYQQERRRAEALAELDQAKTAFFSNVSHEFRTPLTLMLAPLEESLRDLEDPLSPRQRERQEVIRRNSVRLLKLVNTLLDFSRIEAGRVRAAYRPLDLSAAVAELSSSFRSLVEKAGLSLTIACEPLREPVWADQEMLEKIVLNLLSNAFKFTFEGGIRVAVREHQGTAVVEVADTGTGIPASELPRLFERFHRVEGARGRTYEGSGIGLALIRELARLHGGTVTVRSTEGVGSTFSVTLPLGNAHLSPEQLGSVEGDRNPLTLLSFIEEAAQWSRTASTDSRETRKDDSPPRDEPAARAAGPAHLLLADDNADMRGYLQRLLEAEGWSVTAVGDGESALEALADGVPDLVLTDVMMPRLDGFGLLRALRANPRTRAVPVVMLSARAEEESRIDSLQWGADDYLIKPFSTRELLARVRIHLELSRSRRERELQRAALHEIFQEAPAMIAVLRGPEHVFELANPLYLRAIGMRDVLGKSVAEALPELADQPFLGMLDQAYRSGRTVTGDEMRAFIDRRGSGQLEEGFFNFVYRPTRDDRGEVDGIVVFAFDVTDLVHGRRRAEALSEELRLADRRKDEFLAMLAHELRNPMAAISMSLSMLEQPGVDETRARRYRDTARRQMGNLVRLVDDLLDVSRITRGKVELRKTRVDLATVVQNAIAGSRGAIDRGAHELAVTIAPGSFQLEADATRLEQVVTNLLTNAAKYTPRGGSIAVRLSREELDDASWAVLSVRDTGRGIPADMLERVFELFVQVEPTLDRQSGGLGLGLTLVKQLVELHGGTIQARSAGPGAGTEFTARLRLEEGPRPAWSTPPGEPASGEGRSERRRIVIVEDSPDVREALKDVLESLGHEVVATRDGIEGLQRLLELKPDVALVDVGLPGIDGYELARRVRAEEEGRGLVLVALTGYGGDEASARAAEAGFDLHLTKPVDIDELPNVVCRPRRSL